MNKKILALGTIVSVSAPIGIAVSCATTITTKDVKYKAPSHEYLFSKNIQDSDSRAHLIFGELTRDRLTQLPSDITSFYQKKIVASGFGEKRKYYVDGKTETYHAGLDIMRPKNSEILAPFDGEILAQYWYNEDEEFAHGIGTTIIMRTLISKLNIPQNFKELIYVKKGSKVWRVPRMAFIHSGKFTKPDPIKTKIILSTEQEYKTYIGALTASKRQAQVNEEKFIKVSFMHLSKNTVTIHRGRDSFKDFQGVTYKTHKSKHVRYNTSIDFEHPYKIKRGQLMGYIGNIHENGGWQPHVHIEAGYYTTGSAQFTFSRMKRYDTTSPVTTRSPLGLRTWTNAKALGTATKNSIEGTLKHPSNWLNFQHRRSILDPNNIFEIYTDETPKIVV